MRSRPEIEALATTVVDAVFAVHQQLGPGLLESAYHACLAYELQKRGLAIRCQVLLPVQYDDLKLDAGYRIDLLIEDEILLEHKSVQSIAPIHEAQLITYLKLSGLKLGFLVNWNVPRIKDGIRRFVNHL